ncbi:hypothetical protein IWW57_000176 [Coemansia sp. S610]|nr:hypothetical protein IWW57_000176 [Coemansia sp. S610]
MNLEYRSIARILSTGHAPNIVAEVARDLFARWSGGPLRDLVHLGRYVGSVRQSPGDACVDALLRAAGDTQHTAAVAALAFTGGLAIANASTLAVFAALAQRVSEETPQHALLCVDVAAQLGNARAVAELLAPGGHVLRALVDWALGDEHAAELITEIVYAPATRFADAERVVHCIHAMAVARAVAGELETGQRLENMLRAVESVLHRFIADRSSRPLWPVIVDTLALLYPSVLHHYGREEPPEAFRTACSLVVAHGSDAAVRTLFAGQPSLLMSPGDVGGMRTAVVLFHLDIFEHMAASLSARTIDELVLPLAARYADRDVLVYPGAAWFESAHALILSVLESRSTHELPSLVVWYSDLVLDLYLDRLISPQLLCISYTAAVHATSELSVAWERVNKLLVLVDGFTASGGVRGEIERAKRGELLVVVAELLGAVPLELLLQVMFELERRVGEGDHLLVDHCMEVVLDKVDLARKPVLTKWVWQLRADTKYISKL